MIPAAVAFLAGLTFGAGLVVGGMTDANNILAFLDVAGDWDPALALVMASALAVYGVGAAALRTRSAPWFAATFSIPTRRDLDVRLLSGAAVFGVGWGLSGLCPGPSLVLLGGGIFEGVVFVACMLAGMILANLGLDRRGVGLSTDG